MQGSAKPLTKGLRPLSTPSHEIAVTSRWREAIGVLLLGGRRYCPPMSRTTRRALLGFAAATALIAACGPTSSGDDAEGLMQIEVLPADATIVWDNAAAPPVGYTAIGHYADGHTAELVDAVFSLDDAANRLGTLAVAEFTATGAAAGTGSVRATIGEVTGMTGVTVLVHRVNGDDGGVFPDDPPPGGLSPVIAYPLDGAVMPATVKAPDVQWEGAAGGADVYRVRLVGGLATVDTIVPVTAGFKFESQPSAQDWTLLTISAGGQPIEVRVDHWDASTGAQGGQPVHVTAVDADVTGVVYYWNLSQGKMEQIDGAGRAPAIPFPPSSPTDGNNRCVACHVVSRDGRYLAGELWGGGDKGAVFDMSDPAVKALDPAPTVAPVTPTSYTALFSTFNPDASRLLVNIGTQLQLIDPHTGTSVATTGVPLPSANAAHPAWSPDGATIVFANNILNGGAAAGWAVDYTSGDLQTIAVTGPDAFAAPTSLVPSASVDPAFAAPSWPTFSPDSTWIAYGAGVNSRGRNNVGGTEVIFPGALFLIDRGGGTPVQLAAACGGARNCYLPNFSPYDSGGYYWLVFYSLRDYGNAQAGTKGTSRRQMWVAAIDKSKLGTGDPSLVPYWFPDQDAQTENMSAFWALPPPLE